MLLSQGKFAKHCGVSKQAVSKTIPTGQIYKNSDGTIDTEHPVNIEYYQKQQLKKSGSAIIKAEPKPKKSRSVIHEAHPGNESSDIIRIPPDRTGAVEIDGMTMPIANLRRIVAMTEKTKLEVEIKRKELLPKKVFAELFSRMYAIDQNEFITIPDKIIPDIAAIFGVTDPILVTRAHEKLTGELWRSLARIKREIERYLKTNGAEFIDEVDDVPADGQPGEHADEITENQGQSENDET